MAIAIPASDVTNTTLNAYVTAIGTAITNAPTGSPIVAQLIQLKLAAQAQLVASLMATPGGLTPGGILTAATYGT